MFTPKKNAYEVIKGRRISTAKIIGKCVVLLCGQNTTVAIKLQIIKLIPIWAHPIINEEYLYMKKYIINTSSTIITAYNYDYSYVFEDTA